MLMMTAEPPKIEVNWIPYFPDKPTQREAGRCFLLWIDWLDHDTALTAMTPYAVIGKWTGCGWMSQTDDDDSWSGPVKAVTHFARL